jgi:hypothetical protein
MSFHLPMAFGLVAASSVYGIALAASTRNTMFAAVVWRA